MVNYYQPSPIDTEVRRDRLNVNQSFVRQLTTQPQSLTLVTAIVQMAKGRGLAITAEGVEDEATRKILADLGVERAQGYYFSKPLSSRDFGALLSSEVKEAQVSI